MHTCWLATRTAGCCGGMGLGSVIVNLTKKKIGLENVRLLISGGAPLSSATQVMSCCR
jgi:hypothetical protein